MPIISTNVINPNRVHRPVIDPDSGTFEYEAFIEMMTGTPGAEIYYTTDASTPDAGDTLYIGGFSLTASALLRAIGIMIGKRDSAIARANITIVAVPADYDIWNGAYLEAEDAQTIDGYLSRGDPYASELIYVLGLDDDEDGDDEYFAHDVHCIETGTYYLWLRCQASVYSRVQARLDAGAYTSITVSSNDTDFKGWGWHWLRIGDTYALVNGNDYTFRTRRQVTGTHSAPKVDRLFFTTSIATEPPELELIHPNGSERWPLGTDQNITWQSSGDISNIRIEVSYDSGETWVTIVSPTPDSGAYTWTSVPALARSNCRVRISNSADSGTFDVSDGDFLITADTNPFDTSVLMTARFNQSGVGKRPADQGDRPTYLAELEVLGNEQEDIAFRARLYLDDDGDHAPDTEAIDAFRTGNDETTMLLLYNNLYSVHDRDGEAMMGDLSDAAFDNYFLYDAATNIVENPVNGRDNFDFRNTDFLDYMVGRITMYREAGTNGVEFDSFHILEKRVYENGYWHETYAGGVYSDDINIVNPRTGLTYTAEDWIGDFRYAVNYLRQAVDEYFGDTDTVFAINGLYPEHLEEFGDLIDCYFQEGYAGPATVEATLADWWFERNMWELQVNGLILAEARGKYTIPGFGYVAGAPWTQTTNTGGLYIAASILMGIRGPDMKSYLRSRGWTAADWDGWANLRLARFVPEGRYYKTGDDVYRRNFQHAVIYCNPTKVNQAGIALGGHYYYMQNNGTWSAATVDTISLDAGRGAILVTDKTWGE